jgi:asparagine synthase (glutamine-hydrolysing)
MSCFAGTWHFDGKPVDRDFTAKFGETIDQYGPDGGAEHISGSLAMLYRAFHTNRESRLEHQPYISPQGNVLTWDGRLDNRDDLIFALSYELRTQYPIVPRAQGGPQFSLHDYPDAVIVMAAWEFWGTACFRRLIGDFALALWNPRDRVLTFAKDFAGPRHLFYEIRDGKVWWCSRLEPLILLSGRQYKINDEYIAGYFALHPSAHVTPYVGVDPVPAGHFVQIKNGQAKVTEYWQFDPDARIRYKTDAEYEEHYRTAFGQAVKRRLRADSPVLAELSGGRDSGAIVCVADELMARGQAEAPRLDTLSHLDDEEKSSDERPFVEKVEAKRGRVGFHVETTGSAKPLRLLEPEYFCAQPGPDQNNAEAAERRLALMHSQGNRIIFSGIGGDEVTGGVPYAIAGLADLLVEGRFRDFSRQLVAWGLVQKRPCIQILPKAVLAAVVPSALRRLAAKKDIAPWLDSRFIRAQHDILLRDGARAMPRKGLPSFRSNVLTFLGVRNQLGCIARIHRQAARENCYEKSYPYLDRDFVAFMFSIPQEQVLRPGQRRSLMRRALIGIVPAEILNRTRKAYFSRRPLITLQARLPQLQAMFDRPVCGLLGHVDPVRFREALSAAGHGLCDRIYPLMLTVWLEQWERCLAVRDIIVDLKVESESAGADLQSAKQGSFLSPALRGSG